MEKRKQLPPPYMALDFYNFQHRVELIKSSKFKAHKRVLLGERPLWIVGASPFDKVISPDEGHVVHVGKPRFTARWTMVEETLEQIPVRDYFDEDLNIAIYEVIPMYGSAKNIEDWLPEAAFAVAFFKGMIAEVAQSEEH